jgi:hypothetical protein
MQIGNGDFIRVKRDGEFRPGPDGMVMAPPDANGDLDLLFHFDRRNECQNGECVGFEVWNLTELDLSTLQQ